MILAIISLPQRTAQSTRPIMPRTRTKTIVVIMRRVLLGFFLVFLAFSCFLVDFSEVLVDFFISSILVSLMFNSPPSLKSKAWTGLRKSSTVWEGLALGVVVFAVSLSGVLSVVSSVTLSVTLSMVSSGIGLLVGVRSVSERTSSSSKRPLSLMGLAVGSGAIGFWRLEVGFEDLDDLAEVVALTGLELREDLEGFGVGLTMPVTAVGLVVLGLTGVEDFVADFLASRVIRPSIEL